MSRTALLKEAEKRQFDGRRSAEWSIKTDHLVCLHKYGNFYRTRTPFVLRAGKGYQRRLIRILELRHEGFEIELTYERRPQKTNGDVILSGFEFGYNIINKESGAKEEAHGDLKEINYI